MMKYVEERVKEVADYVISTKCTIRKAAKDFGVSKATIQKDLGDRLPKINGVKYSQVREIIEINNIEKCYRGGRTTKKMWEERKYGKHDQPK